MIHPEGPFPSTSTTTTTTTTSRLLAVDAPSDLQEPPGDNWLADHNVPIVTRFLGHFHGEDNPQDIKEQFIAQQVEIDDSIGQSLVCYDSKTLVLTSVEVG